ncbi:MAG: ribosome-associated translation inhibitor RaiA [Deltaproteobacteria bacterium]|nr:ribosome-associated translation inhibitor RaiA [Deltaproteobacteria bacterium]
MQLVGRGPAGPPSQEDFRCAAADSSSRTQRDTQEVTMQVNITFRHLEPTEALKAHVKDKVAHIQRYVDQPSEAHAVLHLENLQHHAEITMKAGPFSVRGRARSEDMYVSIDAAADKIERQLKKHKERMRNHKATLIPKDWTPVDIRHEIMDEPQDSPSARVVSTSRFQTRHMTLDEAIVQMDLMNSRFYVFQDAKTRGIHVVYRRDDDKLGVIEARPA